jgi:hypothetical protein
MRAMLRPRQLGERNAFAVVGIVALVHAAAIDSGAVALVYAATMSRPRIALAIWVALYALTVFVAFTVIDDWYLRDTLRLMDSRRGWSSTRRAPARGQSRRPSLATPDHGACNAGRHTVS